MLDFDLSLHSTTLTLVSGSNHYEAVVEQVRGADCSVWISTANLKELMLPPTSQLGRRRGRVGYSSSLDLFDELAERGVELRILHARLPSQAFRDAFDSHPRLVRGGLELRQCPRVHLKVVIVDGRLLYLGSANWTGAGLGARDTDRRNFELGMISEDALLLDRVQALYDHIWRGEPCARCKLRDVCEAPLTR